ncbi:MAG: metallophosphoesterase [Nanoarchaeota archaeon]|nr:metallophosphoesterase [Nanoarchaeota archaeon]
MGIKILAIGDFHGELSDRLLNRVKKENFDIIISPGDFCGNSLLAKLIFRYYKSIENLVDKIGKKKYLDLERKSFDSGVKILKILNSLNKPVFLIRGNWDPSYFQDIGYNNKKDPAAKRFKNKINKLKNVELIDFKKINYSSYDFIGYPTSSYPGLVNKNIGKKLINRYGKKGNRLYKKCIKDNKKYFSLFKKLFKESKNPIFISHNCPYNTKLDLIKKGPQKGKHYGSWLAKEVILKLKPRLVICGHMHENPGIIHIGKSIVVNPGSTIDNRASIIDIDDRKVKVKFLK